MRSYSREVRDEESERKREGERPERGEGKRLGGVVGEESRVKETSGAVCRQSGRVGSRRNIKRVYMRGTTGLRPCLGLTAG